MRTSALLAILFLVYGRGRLAAGDPVSRPRTAAAAYRPQPAVGPRRPLRRMAELRRRSPRPMAAARPLHARRRLLHHRRPTVPVDDGPSARIHALRQRLKRRIGPEYDEWGQYWPHSSYWSYSWSLYRKNPSQKLKTCVWSCGAFTIGKPKSSAIGTWPSIGTTIRKPRPADTR